MKDKTIFLKQGEVKLKDIDNQLSNFAKLLMEESTLSDKNTHKNIEDCNEKRDRLKDRLEVMRQSANGEWKNQREKFEHECRTLANEVRSTLNSFYPHKMK
jgi:hypothetical protein